MKKALALRPEDRYPTALALAQDIQLYSPANPSRLIARVS